MDNTYLFIGNYKYWLMTDYSNIDPHNDERDHVINRARLYRDRRDFVIEPGDTGRPEDYPNHPAHQSPDTDNSGESPCLKNPPFLRTWYPA